MWHSTRGGTAKASAVVNVSEDIFAGFNAMLRGGESAHVEFIQFGKGRDVGIVQIEIFESKISGGTAISATTRDSFRVCEGMDLARLLSFYHTGAGFYVSNVLVILSLVATIYYMASVALTGADFAILASHLVYLVGDINVAQWAVQLGLLSVLPLLALHALEAGALRAAWRTLRMFWMLGPIFFMFEIATKAYHFDNALTFGRQAYLATGRDFVIRHVAFPETFRATAQSHLYLGAEMLLLLSLTTAFGVFESVRVYVFFFLTSWLFVASLLFGALWFNPLALEWRSVLDDWRDWTAWMEGPAARGADESWRAWWDREVGAQYEHASPAARAVRLVRVSRLLLPAAILVSSLRASRGVEALTLGVFVAAPVVCIVALQLIASAARLAGRRSGPPQQQLQTAAALEAATASRGTTATDAPLPRRGCCGTLGECARPAAQPLARALAAAAGAAA